MKGKAADRKADVSNYQDILNQLDLGDYVTLISSTPYDYGINNDKSRELKKFFEKLFLLEIE